MIYFVCFLAMLMLSPALSQAGEKMHRTEFPILEFARFVAATGYITKAEQTGGMVYESDWVRKLDWNWRQQYGVLSDTQEPEVHVTLKQAEIFCKWRGKRLPIRQE